MESHTETGVIPVVMGGLGNQMFIVAAAYVVGNTHGCPVYLLENPLSNNKHNILGQNYNDTIFKHMGIRLPLLEKSNEFLQFAKQHKYVVDTHDGFQPWYPTQVPKGCIMSSYYQFYPALEPFEEQIRTVFLKGLTRHLIMFQSYDCTKAAFLHVRRGDYLDHPDIHYAQEFSYYQTACIQLLQRVGFANLRKIYVVSDDMDWVRSQPFFQNELFTFYETKDELMTLALMSQCKAGAICANSTFSWWGAFLGAHAVRAPVFVPERWIGGTSLPVALFPEEWTVV
jgi:hypothetical protein